MRWVIGFRLLRCFISDQGRIMFFGTRGEARSWLLRKKLTDTRFRTVPWEILRMRDSRTSTCL